MDERLECKFGVNCYRRNPVHFIEFSHPFAEKIARKINAGYIEHVISLNLDTGVLEQAQHLAELIVNDELQLPQSSNQTDDAADDITENDSSSSKETKESESEIVVKNNQTDDKSANDQSSVKGIKRTRAEIAITSYNEKISKDEILIANPDSSSEDVILELPSSSTAKKIKTDFVSMGSVAEKVESSSPFNYFLSTIAATKNTQCQRLSLTFSDMLDPSLGNLKESLQINFMVELGWLLAQYCYHQVQRKKLLVIYGVESEEMQDAHKRIPTIRTARVKSKFPFGSHHTKMSILSYEDDSFRVIIHTGNLIESDWENRTQGLWISPKCWPAIDHSANDSVTGFKYDLLRYLEAYSLHHLQPWIEKIRHSNMDHINVCFIPSVPGSFHGAESHMWGHGYLQSLLKKHAAEEHEEEECTTIMQASSIGSLGPNPSSWLLNDIGKSMRPGHKNTDKIDLKVIYPCYKDVASSIDGLLGGGCLPYSRQGHNKQKWLTALLHKWRSDGRMGAMPHIKSYCRLSSDLRTCKWFALTSANVSKAAWGMRTKQQSLMIQSYEAGVLFLPKFVNGSSAFAVGRELLLPYDVPLTRYDADDEPWFIDNLR